MLGRRRLRAVAAAAAVLILASIATPTAATPTAATQSVASAEPDHTATLNRADPRFTWEGSGSGVPDYAGSWSGGLTPALRCTGGPFRCEYILLLVEKTGKLTLTLDGTDGGDVSDPTGQIPHCSPCTSVRDIDGYLYRSNAAGDPRGKALTRDCLTPSSSETCKAAVGTGFYVVEVEYHHALEAHYIGTVELGPLRRGRPPPSRRG